jgi:hypothetical protein
VGPFEEIAPCTRDGEVREREPTRRLVESRERGVGSEGMLDPNAEYPAHRWRPVSWLGPTDCEGVPFGEASLSAGRAKSTNALMAQSGE